MGAQHLGLSPRGPGWGRPGGASLPAAQVLPGAGEDDRDLSLLRAATHRLSGAGRPKLCWHGPAPGGNRMKRIWASCRFVSQILDPRERMLGEKWQAPMAPATPGMLVTDTSVLNSSVFRK